MRSLTQRRITLTVLAQGRDRHVSGLLSDVVSQARWLQKKSSRSNVLTKSSSLGVVVAGSNLVNFMHVVAFFTNKGKRSQEDVPLIMSQSRL